MAEEKKDRPAELDKAEKIVAMAGGRSVEALYRDGRTDRGFVRDTQRRRRPRSYTCLWDPHESPALLYESVRLKYLESLPLG
jgi:hypothetical protein